MEGPHLLSCARFKYLDGEFLAFFMDRLAHDCLILSVVLTNRFLSWLVYSAFSDFTMLGMLLVKFTPATGFVVTCHRSTCKEEFLVYLFLLLQI